MANKTTIIGMGALFLLCMGYWFFLVHYVYPKHPEWDFNGTLNQQPQTPTVSPTTTADNSTGSTTIPSIGPATGPSLAVLATQPSAPVSIGSDKPKDPAYALGLQIVSQGAALGSATINSYKDADANGLYIFQQPLEETDYASLATRSVTIDGQSVDLSTANWQLEPGANIATATLWRGSLFIEPQTAPSHRQDLSIAGTRSEQEPRQHGRRICGGRELPSHQPLEPSA